MKITIEESVTNIEGEEKDQVILTVADFDVQHLAIEKSIIDAKGDLIVGSADNTPCRFPAPESDGKIIFSDSSEPLGMKWSGAGSGDVEYLVTLYEGGAVIATGIKADIIFPANLTIKEWVMVGDKEGSVLMGIWHCTYDEFDNVIHPVAGDSICADAKPTISSAHKARDDVLPGWSKSASIRDIWRLNIGSLSNFTRLSFLMIFERTE